MILARICKNVMMSLLVDPHLLLKLNMFKKRKERYIIRKA
jgi:hypothetical protein